MANEKKKQFENHQSIHFRAVKRTSKLKQLNMHNSHYMEIIIITMEFKFDAPATPTAKFLSIFAGIL